MVVVVCGFLLVWVVCLFVLLLVFLGGEGGLFVLWVLVGFFCKHKDALTNVKSSKG